MTQTAPAVAKSAAAGSWTPAQRSAVIASFLAWMFDAFDFFLLVFVLHEVAAEFGTPITSVTVAIVLTLAMRPIGAFVFGRAADRYGRRPTLVVVIVLYSVLELVSAFSPNLVFLICVRALFGIAMGGVWGVGSSLTMETIPPSARGIISGLLQAGYPAGYLRAALVYALLFPLVGWRGLFVLGAVAALLSIYVMRSVQESTGWTAAQGTKHASAAVVLKAHWRLAIYAILLMTAFNFLQPFHSGSLSDVPRGRARLFPRHGRHHRCHLQHWRDPRRLDFRIPFGTDRLPPRDRRCRTSVIADRTALGLLRQPRSARGWGFSDAVHGSGRVGRHSGPSQRAFARGGGGARHFPRRRLPARQSVRRGQYDAPSRHRCALPRRVEHGAGERSGVCRNHCRAADRFRRRSEGGASRCRSQRGLVPTSGKYHSMKGPRNGRALPVRPGA